jgi:hypothetical protein
LCKKSYYFEALIYIDAEVEFFFPIFVEKMKGISIFFEIVVKRWEK